MSDTNSGERERVRLSKDSWLSHTLTKIGEVGVANIQIEALAKELRVTKGSFYWHFKNRDALLSETLEYWYRSATKAIGLAAQRNFEEPIDRLRYFFTLAFNRRPDVPGGPIEQALREWARISEIAEQTTRQVDEDRVSLIADAYSELGMGEYQARQRATMALAQITGLNLLSRAMGKRCQTQNAKAFLEIYLSATAK